MSDNQTAELPGGVHDPDSGRAALAAVTIAIEGLRPDIASVVLTTALTQLSKKIPPARRWQFKGAVENMLWRQMSEL